ncbi:MAG: sigma-54 dependent transcriptional regulator [Bacteroidales bacterium]|nr:sigma-54 dependent transcriptional regulator [Bacteroidales bacterium]
MDIQAVKLRFGIIGNSVLLERTIRIAMQVAPTDLSVLITGESGVGKENFPKIIHQHSTRKHGPYIAVNCGAIPEGTIDSELFGHEKGAFTGAHEARKGYFEVVNGGTIFLDEVAEMPLSTQARLLRILESGEFIRVGSSKIQKTDVRVVAASNVEIPEAIQHGKFREDLFYRLNTVPIKVPSLRERKEDILLLFRKFCVDFSEKFRIPVIQLSDSASEILKNYRWPGNVRQLKNVAEQVSIIEQVREIDAATLLKYLPTNAQHSDLPVLYKGQSKTKSENFERELIFNFLHDLRRDVQEMKGLIGEIIKSGQISPEFIKKASMISHIPDNEVFDFPDKIKHYSSNPNIENLPVDEYEYEEHEVEETIAIDESLSIQKVEKELIKKALEKYNGRRKLAAQELGFSERTLYRKIKDYELE